MEKIRIITKEQLEHIANVNKTDINEYPKQYPCILLLIEYCSNVGDYCQFYYVYENDFKILTTKSEFDLEK